MLVNRADSHKSTARFVRQPARWPEPLLKKDDTANMTRFYLQLCFLPKPKYFMRTETPAEKRRTLPWAKTTAETRKYFTLTKALAEKVWLLLLPKPLPRKDKPVLETLQSQPWTKPKPWNKANQNHCNPKRKRKTLKPILATRQNQPELMPAKKTPPNERAKNLKTCLLKKYWPNAYLKSAVAEARNIFLWIGNRHAEKIFSSKTKLAIQRRFWFCSWLPNGLR